MKKQFQKAFKAFDQFGNLNSQQQNLVVERAVSELVKANHHEDVGGWVFKGLQEEFRNDACMQKNIQN